MEREYRILLLEDAASDADLVERELRKGGLAFSLKHVATKVSFAKELEDFAPDIILSDYKLPQFDGLTALSMAKKEYPDIPFIMISGAIGDDLAVEVLKNGATDYILKDRLARLVPAVQRALHEIEIMVIKRELETRTQQLELENKEMHERELKIRKVKRDLEHLKDQLNEMTSEG